MKHEIKKEKDFIFINLEHEQSEIERAFNKEYATLAKNLKMNGFRPGKVPISIAKNIIKIDEIKEKVINDMVREEVDLLQIEEEKYDEIEIKVKDFDFKNKLISEVKYYLYPILKIKDDYLENIKTVKLEKLNEDVTDSEINEEIENLRKENASYVDHDEINDDSLVICDMKCVDIDTEETFFEENDYELIMKENEDVLLKEKIISLKQNDTLDFIINYPADYQVKQFENKNIKFGLTVKEIKKEVIPEVDENFIKEIFEINEGTTVENYFDLLNQKIKEKILETRKEKNDAKNYELIIDFMVSQSEYYVSDYVIQKEKIKIFKNFLSKNELDENMSFKDFSKLVEKDESETDSDFVEIAKNKIVSYLILTELNKLHNIYKEQEEISEDSIKDMLNKNSNSMNENDFISLLNKMSSMFENDKNDFMISKENINKTINFLIEKINS